MNTKDSFRGLLQRQSDDAVTTELETIEASALPPGDVTVAVEFSTLNYKDGLVLKGLGGLVRNYPHVPGIDFAGTVEASEHPDYKPGDPVILTGWRVGEVQWGGYAEKARVSGDWLVPMPAGMDSRGAMALGTAGFTAMLAVIALEDQGVVPGSDGEVLVTGAAGGVGSVAVAILAKLGYQVAAGTGREETHGYLQGLGAASIVGRDELEAPPKGPLSSERWASAIDNVGGPILANLLGALKTGGSCAAVGLAASPKLETTVIPFLLRGVNLLGIDSVMCPQVRRREAWRRLSQDFPAAAFDDMTTVVGLGDLPGLADQILSGQVRGRTVVDVNA